MRKLVQVLLGFIILVGLFSLWNAFSTVGDFTQILLPALAAIFIIVIAISIVPWLSNRGH
jgi:hypothetical protein